MIDRELSETCIDDKGIITPAKKGENESWQAFETIISKSLNEIHDISLQRITPSAHRFIIVVGENQLDERKKLETRFDELAKKWRDETGGISAITDICTNVNYQRIIALGEPVVPLILKELEKRQGHWYWALSVLVDEKDNPITTEIGNSYSKTREAWIRWGTDKGWLRQH